jgi:hypothetical protein
MCEAALTDRTWQAILFRVSLDQGRPDLPISVQNPLIPFPLKVSSSEQTVTFLPNKICVVSHWMFQVLDLGGLDYRRRTVTGDRRRV